ARGRLVSPPRAERLAGVGLGRSRRASAAVRGGRSRPRLRGGSQRRRTSARRRRGTRAQAARRQGRMIRINLAPEAKRRRGFGFPGLPAFKLPSFNLGVLFGLIYVIAIVGVTAYWLLLAKEGRRLTAQIAAGQEELEQLNVTI